MSDDEQLEAAINRVGRDRVLATAAVYGWKPYDAPPKWVWWGIVHELNETKTEQAKVIPFKTGG